MIRVIVLVRGRKFYVVKMSALRTLQKYVVRRCSSWLDAQICEARREKYFLYTYNTTSLNIYK